MNSQGCIKLHFCSLISYLLSLTSYLLSNILRELFTLGRVHVGAFGMWPVRDGYTSLECCSLRSRARFARPQAFGLRLVAGGLRAYVYKSSIAFEIAHVMSWFSWKYIWKTEQIKDNSSVLWTTKTKVTINTKCYEVGVVLAGDFWTTALLTLTLLSIYKTLLVSLQRNWLALPRMF